ncbi:MAG: hypothetical protein L3J24_08780 [Xanthomonadales bacterium]|nr:hypothetical protein [Xanthomonadales bacterium]
MGIFTSKFKFTTGPNRWAVQISVKGDVTHYRAWRNDAEIEHQEMKLPLVEMAEPQTWTVPTQDGEMVVTFGYVSWTKMACTVNFNGELVYRSHKKPFRGAGRFTSSFKWLNKVTAEEGAPKTIETLEKEKRAKDLQPSILVDIALGFMFFFVAREFSLVNAALAGAGVTIALFIVQRFVKVDLLGGFAVFGVFMALVSAGLSYLFQDDTIVKLRGTIMALIVAWLAIIDGVLGGKYLGVRMARYMEGLFSLNPRRAAFALAISTLLIMAIDLPLVFILTTDQWIWYNAFLDSLIAIPIFIGAMWLARDKGNKKC